MQLQEFESTALRLQVELEFPEFSNTRIMMMPFAIGSTQFKLAPQYQDFLEALTAQIDPEFLGQIGYLTIDEKIVYAGETLRRPGLHVDGVYNGSAGGWGGGGPWGGGGKKNPNDGNGMILVSSTPHCRFYTGIFDGEIGNDGECDQIDVSAAKIATIEPNVPYWCNPLCIHESLPVPRDMPRQFVRISLPSVAPWFEGYTENPDGTRPTGPILSERTKQMSFSGYKA